MEVREEDRAHADVRARVVRLARAERRRRPMRMAVLVFAPAAVLAAVLAVVLGRVREEPAVAFVVGETRAVGLVGGYLVPSGAASLPVSFSDGSTMVLMPSTRARVTSTTARGAQLLLESGRVECDIRHLPGAAWAVSAGPYSIDVIGTSFDVTWDTQRARLEVQMRHGAVRVRGPGVDDGVELRDRQRLTVGGDATASGTTAVPTIESAPVGVTSAPAATVGVSAARSVPDVATSPVASGSEGSMAVEESPTTAGSAEVSNGEVVSWSQRVARGEYAVVVSEAEARGIDGVLGAASMADVGALADAARFVGKGSLATRCLHTLRSRFPGTARAASAAFVLGRTAEDAGSSSTALGWYDTYLAEAPGGPLAPEALGRRMLALRRMGNTGAARQAAEVYLRRFPNGPYSGVAREMTTP